MDGPCFFLKNMSNRLTITYANDFSAQKYKKHLEYARILRKKCVFYENTLKNLDLSTLTNKFFINFYFCTLFVLTLLTNHIT